MEQITRQEQIKAAHQLNRKTNVCTRENKGIKSTKQSKNEKVKKKIKSGKRQKENRARVISKTGYCTRAW